MIPFRAFAVIPAAGNSLRMGQPKLLLPWRGRALIDHVLAAWTASRVDRVVIVVRPDDESLIERCREFDIDVVTPREPPADMKASVRLGVEHLEAAYHPLANDGWLLAPADMPLLSAAMIDGVIDAYDPQRPIIIAPRHASKRGHPVLLPWMLAAKLRELPRDQGVNALLNAHPVCEIAYDEPGILADIDTPDEYQSWVR